MAFGGDTLLPYTGTFSEAAIVGGRVRGSSLARGVGEFAGPVREGFIEARDNVSGRARAVIRRADLGIHRRRIDSGLRA